MKHLLANFLSQLGKIWLEKTITKQVRISLALILLQLGVIIFFFPRLPPQLPLFFSRPWGEAQLTSPLTLILLPAFSFVFLIINSLLSSLFLEEKVFLAQLLIFGSTLFNFFNLIALIKIITLVL